jgi:hypothetical protein
MTNNTGYHLTETVTYKPLLRSPQWYGTISHRSGFIGVSRLNVNFLCNKVKHYCFTRLKPPLDVECLIGKKLQKNNNIWKVYAYL